MHIEGLPFLHHPLHSLQGIAMQITDNREQMFLGVQRLRAMASASYNRSPSALGMELSIASSAHHNASEKLKLSSFSSSRSEQAMEASKNSPPVQLELLPLRPSCQKSTEGLNLWNPYSGVQGNSRGIDVNQMPCTSESEEEDGQEEADPMLKLLGLAGSGSKLELGVRERGLMADPDQERTFLEASSRASDEDESGSVRKKLRLSKEQSALLEESFKKHSTLNPKQKSVLARQLNLRPRQVEVWFQNRRARTKLKQTEVDCELLKRCCESLTEENRRLQKEVAELRALKVGAPRIISHDFYMPLPAATLTMCPSCERLAPRGGTPSAPSPAASVNSLPFANKPNHFPLVLSSPSAAC